MERVFMFLMWLIRPKSAGRERQRGATMIEYALIVAVISIAIIALASTVFEDGITAVGSKISTAISGSE
jgi:Flp pilus assembly pilin Flp